MIIYYRLWLLQFPANLVITGILQEHRVITMRDEISPVAQTALTRPCSGSLFEEDGVWHKTSPKKLLQSSPEAKQAQGIHSPSLPLQGAGQRGGFRQTFPSQESKEGPRDGKTLWIIFQNIWYMDHLENTKVLPGKSENLDEMLKKIKQHSCLKVFLKKLSVPLNLLSQGVIQQIL